MICDRHSVSARGQTVVWLLACAAVACRAEIPPCTGEAALRNAQVRKIAFAGGLSPETLLIYRAPGLPEIGIQARFAADGSLACASPLSGWSIYWDAAIATLQRSDKIGAPPESSWIFLFEDPGRVTVRQANDSVRSSKTCTDLEQPVCGTVLSQNSNIFFKKCQFFPRKFRNLHSF